MNEIYLQRRNALLQSKEGPCMICIFSGSAPMKSLDSSYPFYVDRNFYYLTGIDRENMILLLRKAPDGTTSEVLYIEPYDEVLAKWVGGRMRADEATEVSGIRAVRNVEDFNGDLNGAINISRGMGKMNVWLDLWRHRQDQADTPAHLLAAHLRNRYPAVNIDDIFGDMAAMRAIKSEDEIAQMRCAQEATKNAVIAMMRHAKPGINERELEGAFDFSLMQQGVREHAFPSIIAGGGRATVLHYENNNQIVKDGEMVLTDLGSAHNHYCADITRTFPVNGKFTDRQKQLYNTVLAAQQLVMDTAKPGMTLQELNQLVIDYYESKLPELDLRGTVRDYYYHNVSHQLPFTMNIDFGKVTDALKEIGYTGWLTLEADCYCEGATPETVPQKVQNLYSAARRLADMME